jgi:GNAT superfamily N-acetyltransferase
LRRTGDAIDINYFGLTPEYTGQGLGGPLLAAAVERAWSLAPARVTVNTCTLDHPAALPNYLARGFAVARTEQQRRTID